jgi:hypothetical protein
MFWKKYEYSGIEISKNANTRTRKDHRNEGFYRSRHIIRKSQRKNYGRSLIRAQTSSNLSILRTLRL